MNKRILKRYSLGFLCLIGSLASCSLEQPAKDSTFSAGKPVEVRLQVKAPLGSDATANPETDINRLRMVVFGSMGSPDAGKLILNKYYSKVPEGNVLKEIITSGRRDIYLIANEPLSEADEVLDSYKNIATVADVRKLSLAYQGASSSGIYIPEDIPMFVGQLNQQISVDAPNTIGGAVERTMAKVTLNLNVKSANFPAGKPVVIDHITIKNLPESSFLIPQNYTGELVTSEKQNAGVVTAVGDYNFSTTNTFYVPEYLFNDPSKGAYIEITGHVNGDPSRVAKYSVKLGNAMGGEPYSDYHITRNRHYTFTGDVKSYGEMDGVAVTVTVAEWETVNMEEATGGRYISFGSVTETDGAGTTTTIGDGDNLSEAGTTLNVECRTNIGGWYTVTRNAKGAIIHKSAATASVSEVTSQSVSMLIPNLKELPYLQSYTVRIYHRIIAQESVGPVKALHFTQYGGFIPNSVLEDAKWPKDKLPPHGLQLAKRGKGVLPSGEAEIKDSLVAWKTENSSTSKTDAKGLGMGADNTAAMDSENHPAAQYCRGMGEGWFLPSKEELLLIYNNQPKLGTSYKYTPNGYWSATEYSNTISWVVYFADGLAYNHVYKDSTSWVRCVRAI